MGAITISSGHWYVKNSGASDILNEVTEARKVVNRVVEILKASKITVNKVEDNSSRNQNENLGYLVSQHNKSKRDIDVSVHFNASAGTQDRGIGTEVLYVSPKGKTMAQQISTSIANAGGFKNRGHKHRDNLSFLLKTHKPSILLEVCFVNSREDAQLYNSNFEKICQAIAKDLASFVGEKLVVETVKPKPMETKPEPHRVKSGTYSTIEQVESAKADVAKNKIASEKYISVLEANGKYYFQTGSYPDKASAEKALEKMKDLKILSNGHIIKA